MSQSSRTQIINWRSSRQGFRPSSGWRVWRIDNSPLMMTILTDCHSQNSVIPTEKPLGFDEESRVCNSQSRKTQSINCRSSRRSFHSLLRMTGLRDCYFEIYITIPLRMTNLRWRYSINPVIPTEKPLGFDEESTAYMSQSSKTRITHCRSSRRSFHSLLRMTGLRDCYFEIILPFL